MSTDYTPIGPVPSGIANGTVDATSRQLARDMRGKAYGKDVRETIARMTEWHSIRSSAAEVLAAQSVTSAKASEVSAKQSAQEVTKNAQDSIKLFNDAISQQSQKIDNMVVDLTDKDINSAPEIVAARRGKASLGAKIDDVEGQLAQKATKGEIGLSDINKSRTQFDGTWFSESFLNNLNNGEINTTNLVNGGVKEKHIATNVIQSEHVSFLSDENLFGGEYSHFTIAGDKANGGAYLSNAEGRMAVIDIKPNTTYRIVKEPSDKFRIGLNKTYPVAGSPVGNFIKDAQEVTPEDQYSYVVTSGNTDYFICVYVSNVGNSPNLLVQEFDKVTLNKPLIAPNVVKSKNLSKGSDSYITGTLGTSLYNGKVYFTEKKDSENDGILEILPVEPNTDYTISKSSSNRFRIGLCEVPPTSGVSNIDLVFNNDSENKTSIVTGNKHRFMIIYNAFETPPPTFMQVEKGTEQTEWETYGYKLYPLAKPYSVSKEPDSQIITGITDVKQFGAKGDGVTDDSDAILSALEYAKGGILIFPQGVYMTTKTLWIHGNTQVIGLGAKIILGDNYNLDTINWRDSTTASPIIANVPNENNILIKGLKVEGNKNRLLSTSRMLGIVFADTENSKIIDTQVNWINMLGDMTGQGWGYNIATVRAENIDLIRCSASYGGYENFAIYDDSKDVNVFGGFSGVGWRTSFQVHRGSKNIKVIGLDIKQNHPEAHSAFTIHGSIDKPVNDVLIDGMYLESDTDTSLSNRGGLQTVEGHEHGITLVNSTLITNNHAVNTSSDFSNTVKDWIIQSNKITADGGGIKFNLDGGIIKDNIIDSEQTAIEGKGFNYIEKDNILRNNKDVILTGEPYVD